MSIHTVDRKEAAQEIVSQSDQMASPRNGTPPLLPGDYLTRAGFERVTGPRHLCTKASPRIIKGF